MERHFKTMIEHIAVSMPRLADRAPVAIHASQEGLAPLKDALGR